MASNYTENYGLCQWEATDQVLRTEFNEDNVKLEEALSDLEARVALLDRAVPNLAYNIYDLAMKDYTNTGYHGRRTALLMDTFLSQANIASMTGGLVVQNKALVLTGAGKTGTMTTHRLSVGTSDWSRVVAWLKYSLGGLYTMSVNGVALENQNAWSSRTADGIECQELYFAGDVAGNSSAEISITLNTLTSASAMVYEYGVIFL